MNFKHFQQRKIALQQSVGRIEPRALERCESSHHLLRSGVGGPLACSPSQSAAMGVRATARPSRSYACVSELSTDTLQHTHHSGRLLELEDALEQLQDVEEEVIGQLTPEERGALLLAKKPRVESHGTLQRIGWLASGTTASSNHIRTAVRRSRGTARHEAQPVVGTLATHGSRLVDRPSTPAQPRDGVADRPTLSSAAHAARPDSNDPDRPTHLRPSCRRLAW